jgi:hypothetical protein
VERSLRLDQSVHRLEAIDAERPSILDRLRGWKRQPMARKGANGGDASHGPLKAAA